MNITSLHNRGSAAFAWLKKQPKAIVFSMTAFAILLIVAGLVAIPHHHHAAAVAVSVPSPAPPAPVAVVQQAAAPATVPTPVQAASVEQLQAAVSQQAGAATPAPAPVNPITTPAGLVAGQVIETISNADQFGQYTAVSARAVGSVRTSWQSYVGPAYSPAWRETITGWFQLSAPATVATLRRGGGAAANLVSAEIDGASLGPALRGPASGIAALPLSAGWHSFTVTAENKSLSYLATATPIELAVGNGVDTPMPVVPWAVVAAPAPSPSTSGAASAGSAK